MQETQIPTLTNTASAYGLNDLAERHHEDSAPRLVRPTEAMHYEIPGEKGALYLDSLSTGNKLVAGTLEVAPHAGPPPHIHENEDEIFIVESGEIEFFVNGEYIVATTGDVVFGARNEAHFFRGLPSSEPNRVTGIVAPSGFERFFAGRAQLMASPNTTPEMLVAQAAEFGIRFFAPDTPIPVVENPKSRIVRAGTAPTLEAFGDHFEILLSAEQTGHKYTLVSTDTTPNSGPPLHVHHKEDELFFIQRGQYEFTIEVETDGIKSLEKVVANPGDMVWAPRNHPHNFRNIGEGTARMLVAVFPGAFDIFLQENAKVFEANTATMQKLMEIGEYFGIKYLV